MSMYNSIFSGSQVLSEQIARQIFNVLPDDGPMMVIMDRDGHIWPSDSARFSELNPDEKTLMDICDKIDDGAEPVVSQIGDYSIVASQLATDNHNCGYVIIAMPQSSPESTFANMDLVEILLAEVGLIAKLIEKNNHLYEHQIKQYSATPQTVCASN